MITVQTRAAGRRRPIVPDFELPPRDPAHGAGSAQTLRDLITRIVGREVDAFRTRQRDNRFLHALTPAQIEQVVEAGAVRSGGSGGPGCAVIRMIMPQDGPIRERAMEATWNQPVPGARRLPS